MKRILACLLLLSMLMVAFASCAEENTDPKDSESVKDSESADTSSKDTTQDTEPPLSELDQMLLDTYGEENLSCPKYDIEKYLAPYWESNIIYNEPLLMYKDENGIASAPLLFTPTKVLEVRSSDLKTLYKEGRDYTVDGQNIVLTGNSRIPCQDYDEIFFDEYIQHETWPTENGATIFREGGYLHSLQIAVTYYHEEEWLGYEPEYMGDNLAKTIAKLENGESIKIVFYGDSITQGGNASGMFNIAPYSPTYPNLVVDMLQKAYPDAQIESHVVVMSNTDSAWAISNCKTEVFPQEPDLLIVAFGMNDSSRSPAEFKSNQRLLRRMVQRELPDCEYIFVGTMVANDLVYIPNTTQKLNKNQPLFYKEALLELVEEGTIAVNVTEVHEYILETKRYLDISGNNVNHPNDFVHRAYAMTICSALIENYASQFPVTSVAE